MDDAQMSPIARKTGLVTTSSGREALVYDLDVHHIHHLNEVTTVVWNLCDGQRTVGAIAQESGLTEDIVVAALGKLHNVSLLIGDAPKGKGEGRQSRRAFAKKAGVVLAPTIISVTAPLASAHASDGLPVDCVNPGGSVDSSPCFADYTCCSGFCYKENGSYQGTCQQNPS